MKPVSVGCFLFLVTSLFFIPPAPAAVTDSLFWVPVSRALTERIIQFSVSNDTIGWVTTEFHHLFRWNGSDLIAEPQLPNEKVRFFRIISPDNIWLAVHLKDQYRHCLKHFDGVRWSYVKTPNSHQFYDLIFPAPTSGWAIGEWGEIIHFDGTQWRRAESPTNYHLTYITMPTPHSGWIAGQSRGQGILLQYKNGAWKIRQHFIRGEPQLLLAPTDSVATITTQVEQELHVYQFFAGYEHEIPLPEAVANDNSTFFFFIFKQQLCGYSRRTGRFFLLQDNAWQAQPWGVIQPPLKISIARDNFLFSHEGQLFQLRQIRKSEFPPVPKIIRFEKLEMRSQIEYGVAVGDINNDQHEDLYIVNHEGVNRLVGMSLTAENAFWDGGASAAKAAGVSGELLNEKQKENKSIYDSGISMADIDNDGDLDLYLCSMYQPNILYNNNGKGKFRNFTRNAGVGGESMAFSGMGIWGDVNGDSYLDLFVTNALKSDKLYLNDGTGRFRDVTEAAGLASTWGSTNPAFADFDNDQDLDLFIGHDAGKIRLMRNQGILAGSDIPQFANVTAGSGLDTTRITDCRCGIWGDVDNDADQDLFLALAWLPDKLYLNDGHGFFQDVSLTAGFVDSSNSKGAVFFDADNDGLLDLFIGQDGPNMFYHNQGGGRFAERTKEFGLEESGSSTGVVACDIVTGTLPPDGRLDLYVARMDKPSCVYYNWNFGNSFLRFKLVGTRSNRDAIGAKIYLYPAGHPGETALLRGFREVQAGGGYHSMSSSIVHFGVQPNAFYDALFIFPTGLRVVRQNLAAGQLLTIYEEDGLTRIFSQTRCWLWRNLRDPENHREGLLLLILALTVFGFHQICRKKFWGNRKTHLPLLLLPLILYLLIKLITPIDHLWLYDGLALGVGILIAGVFLWYNYSFSRQINREDLLLQLLMICRAFEHSQSLASYLNQLKLVFSNLKPQSPLPDEVLQLTYEAISNFYQFIYKEVRQIIELAGQIFPNAEAARKMKSQLLALSAALDEIKIQLNLKGKVETPFPSRVGKIIAGLQENLKWICHQTSQHFSSPLIKTLDSLIRNFSQTDLVIEKADLLAEPEIWVRIQQSELIFVLENLFTNALRALQTQSNRRIRITLSLIEQRVMLLFEDNGCGISPEIQVLLFEHGVSSKSGREGGFGLYHSKMLVQKYGGSIYLKRTQVGEGSEFVVVLKRIG